MKFKIDENLPLEVADVFRESGHDASTVVDESLCGERDGVVWALSLAEGRCLVTLDLDFSDIRVYLRDARHGIIVVRTADQSKPRVMALAEQTVPALETEPLHGRLWIVEDGRIRIRAGAE